MVISTAHGLKFSDFKVGYHEGTLPGLPSPLRNPGVQLAGHARRGAGRHHRPLRARHEGCIDGRPSSQDRRAALRGRARRARRASSATRASVDHVQRGGVLTFFTVIALGMTAKLAWDRWGWLPVNKPPPAARLPALVHPGGAAGRRGAGRLRGARPSSGPPPCAREEEALFARLRSSAPRWSSTREPPRPLRGRRGARRRRHHHPVPPPRRARSGRAAGRSTSPPSRRAARSARWSARCSRSGSTAGRGRGSTPTRWRSSSPPTGATTSPPRCCRGWPPATDVVSDRYTLSSLAYQGLTTGDMAWVEADQPARRVAPDLTIFLEVRRGPGAGAPARRRAPIRSSTRWPPSSGGWRGATRARHRAAAARPGSGSRCSTASSRSRRWPRP